MNDRHPAGDSFPADPGADYSSAGYDSAHYEQSAYGTYGTAAYATAAQHDAWSTGAYDTHGTGYAPDAGYYGDPLYGPVPGTDTPHASGCPAPSYDGTGNELHGTDGYGTAYDAYGTAGHGHATGAYDTTAWTDGSGTDHSGAGFIPHQPGPDQAEYGWSVPTEGSVQWDVSAFESTAPATTGLDNAVLDPTAYGAATGWDGSTYGHQATDGSGFEAGYDLAGYDQHGHPGAYDQNAQAAYAPTANDRTAYGTGAYDSVGWTDGAAYGTTVAGHQGEETGPHAAEGADAQAATVVDFHEQPTAAFDAYQQGEEAPAGHPGPAGAEHAHGPGDGYHPVAPYDPADPYGEPVVTVGSEAEPEPGAVIAGPQGRGRRRSPKPRRSALLTVAAPSVAVLGVAGIAAASVIPAGDEETAQAAPDTTEVKVSPANTKLDTQLAGLREAGDDFADRASRTQERIDLKKRQEAERKRKAAEAARREALRPKFALPVEGFGVSAYFGQAGINWMSVHTGLDFPASYGTPVKAATDGTVSTQWNPAYGNMMIVTAADGTETWYCHLSSTRIRSGTVQAGDVIGYTGNSGNSTGPHLHFEVRPGGGSAVDPLSWFRSHGLEPN
ncbi:M23 family metallopeptidase [Streptomyces sp. RKND-216]|uniref:M23 family metallopeptidase n=1 Tax=Streptomyces sp. RKND-216 TaxID=2562581 RepID=UPI001FFA3500|nr:M23 family metallopeptidase [Streptomyces sp. RKND-216]